MSARNKRSENATPSWTSQEGFIEGLISIIERAFRYQRLLHYPGEGTERMLRGWIAMELLLGPLAWRPQNILFGETFDLLLVDDRIRPVLYIETKSLEQQISPKDIPNEIKRILKRTGRRPTLKKMILTNGIKWIVFNVSNSPKIVFELEDVRTANPKEASLLERYLSSKYYIVRGQDDRK